MTGISDLFRKRPPRREPVSLEADIVIDSIDGETVGVVIVMNDGRRVPAVHLLPGEKIHLTLKEILP